MKILYLTKYTPMGASSRMRSYQYFPDLEKSGLKVTVRPFFSDKYLKALYAGQNSWMAILQAYVKRLLVICTVFQYDRIVIQYELFPFFPAWFEQLFKASGIRYMVDYDDAIFHNYDLHPNKWVRKFLGKKIDHVMGCSGVVIAGNEYLANRAKIAGAQKIIIIPTVIDLLNYKYKENYTTEKFTIGWIGSPSTYKYLQGIKNELINFASQNNAEIIVIGAYHTAKYEPPFRFIPWKAETENEWIRKFDVGLMPLDDTPWSKGKCSFKLIQYMASGVPVIASPVGMNTEVVTEENGFLASDTNDWIKYLTLYFEDTELRAAHGEMGRQMVEDKYALQVTAKQWIQLLKMENGI